MPLPFFPMFPAADEPSTSQGSGGQLDLPRLDLSKSDPGPTVSHFAADKHHCFCCKLKESGEASMQSSSQSKDPREPSAVEQITAEILRHSIRDLKETFQRLEQEEEVAANLQRLSISPAKHAHRSNPYARAASVRVQERRRLLGESSYQGTSAPANTPVKRHPRPTGGAFCGLGPGRLKAPESMGTDEGELAALVAASLSIQTSPDGQNCIRLFPYY